MDTAGTPGWAGIPHVDVQWLASGLKGRRCGVMMAKRRRTTDRGPFTTRVCLNHAYPGLAPSRVCYRSRCVDFSATSCCSCLSGFISLIPGRDKYLLAARGGAVKDPIRSRSLCFPREIFPYLVVVIGLENVLVLTKSVVSTPVDLEVKLRIAQGKTPSDV